MSRVSVRNPKTGRVEACVEGETEEQCLARLTGEPDKENNEEQNQDNG